MNHYFSTDDVHPRDRIPYMQDVACRTYVDVECIIEKNLNYCASIESSQLAMLGLSKVTTDPCEVVRTKSNIATSRADDILLSMQIEGTSTLTQDGRDANLLPGHFALYDTQRTYKLKTGNGTKQLVIKIPRSSLEPRLGNISHFTAHSMNAENPISKIAFGFLSLLPTNKSIINTEATRKIAEQAIELLSLAFTHECAHKNKKQTPGQFTTLTRLKSVIESNFTDPDFKPSEAAIRTGISTRYANKLLNAEGSSVESYIYSRRLERCRQILNNPQSSQRTISEISHSNGFNCASHFTKRFKHTYGLTPQEYRKTLGIS